MHMTKFRYIVINLFNFSVELSTRKSLSVYTMHTYIAQLLSIIVFVFLSFKGPSIAYYDGAQLWV